MPDANHFDVGDAVFVVDDGFDPVVQSGVVAQNRDQYPSSVEVRLDDQPGRTIGCHPDQIIRADAGADEVDAFLDIQDRLDHNSILGHPVTLQVTPDEYDGSIAYRCEECGLRSNKVSTFDQYSCDEYRHNPARKNDV